MKKLALPIALLLVSGLAFGKSKPLADKQLDKISAGSAIANGESTATDSREFELELEGSAQKGASALNIVNPVDSLVANATNISASGRTEDDKKEDGEGGRVKQLNVIVQKGVPCDCKPGADWARSENREEEESDWAFGNAIALDGSTAHNSTKMELELEDHAQEGAHALNIVNAVGSQVANATNISIGHSPSSLTQVNVIVQLAH